MTRPVPDLGENALKVLEKRYLRRDEAGNLAETPEGLFVRVAEAVAAPEAAHGGDPKAWAEVFYGLMARGDFLPNSPTLMNAGTPLGQLSACFVLPVGDSMEEIFDALKHTALVHKSGGGTGFDFSDLRPAGDRVRSTSGVASGPLSFLELFDRTTEVIKQGGMRRGANMGILEASHPDVMDFVRAKTEQGRLGNFNISVGVTDRFLRAVRDDGSWDLVNPRTGETVRTLPARELWRLLVDSAWRTGDPGLVFLDRIEEDNPTPHLGRLRSTNPCVTGDTWVLTDQGPRQVGRVAGLPLNVVVDGRVWRTEEEGFFPTGVRPVLRLVTREGYSLRLTGDHPVCRVVRCSRSSLKTRWTPAGDLKRGDRVLVNDHRSFPGWAGEYGEGEGYLLGLLVGDGTLKKDKAVLSVWSKEEDPQAQEGIRQIMQRARACAVRLGARRDFRGWMAVEGRGEYRLSTAALRRVAEDLGMGPGRKGITPELESRTSSSFVQGFLRGLFDADGSVQGTLAKGISLRLSQSDLPLLEGVQRLLLRLGIGSRIYRNRRSGGSKGLPDGRGGVREYTTKPQHELVVVRENLDLFWLRVGFGDSRKASALRRRLEGRRRLPYRERFLATVEELVPEGDAEVFDVRVPGCHAFDANGFLVHNCGEQPLLPYESCNLGSINLVRMADEAGELDWEKLDRTVRHAVRFLDDVIDANCYPLPEIAQRTRASRKIGLGIMGWADLLFLRRLRYGSPESLVLAGELMGFIRAVGHEASEALGEERGAFPAWEGSLHQRQGRRLRNATVTTLAPTGTISLLAGCSSGIEPAFSLALRRRAFESDTLVLLNPVFQRDLAILGEPGKDILARVLESGSLEGTDVPLWMKQTYVTAHEVSLEDHVRTQAAFQAHTDNGVSKTVNLPHEAGADQVERAFLLAHETGCKGITVYRDRCKETQVLYQGTGEVPSPGVPTKPKRRPAALTGSTVKVRTSFGNLYLTLNRLEGKPFELFATLGKSGRDTQAHTEALGRLVSLALRSGVPVRDVVGQLKGIGGSQPVFEGDGMVLSLPDAIAQGIERVLGETVEVSSGDMCPSCGAPLVHAEGCLRCVSCDYSKCL
ncbi:ribonucleoside-diphosphate reductase, adenosylcobalamin-dependent [Aminomonas paucivorans DSM 12260]|uniref:Ribonucleoside-diphosphate reductase n=1 Tax=Aminomonas paucivorans DSM 12260 TaxID=584708 RepID=E3CWA2_9BACT|nr:ribonucleotide reductase N-terminal alpha domain-containing protein [Aminomonas paucivorans]EFQ23354.1 ribonucleoside-diphosphate reductase, adenosylcobalamin-dependent [Aminomonas paucivorans DSM 12260]